MSWTYDKQRDEHVWAGMATGIAPSPHKGSGNLQNVNVSTEQGEVMASYSRSQASMTSGLGTGSLTFIDTSHVNLTIANTNNKFKGVWITVSASSHAGELPNANYWVTLSFTGGFQLATTYGGSALSGYTAGLTATITPMRSMGRPLAYATETYSTGGATYYRYYVLDGGGLVWAYDTVNDVFPSDDQQYWYLPDTDISYWGSDAAPSGVGVLNGVLFVLAGNKLWTKHTVKLGSSYVQMTNALMMSRANSLVPHFALTGHQGRMYYTDGAYLGSLFPDTSLLSGVANVQSYASWSGSVTTGTITELFGGSIPSTGANVGATGFSRIPAVFFSAAGGANPTALAAHTVYWISYSTANANFEVYAAQSGGAALNVATGASGVQYFNTFYVIGTHAGAYGNTATMTFSPQRLALPIFETSTCLAEIGNTVIVGTQGNILYPWNQIDATPSSIIALPEANTAQLLTVNQMAYAFAGSKGNVYITDGNVASLVIKVPDYCAGVPGTVASYYEPTFAWGGVMYLRGRVYFSVQDQTSTKAGNCGGVWSFVPTQNLYVGQDTGLALRLENRNSYGTYSGAASVLIPLQAQTSVSPQYFSGWFSGLTSITYGIDRTGTVASDPAVVETDFLPTGTFLEKKTFSQVEYKVSAPLASGDTVQLWYRVTSTDAWATCGTVKTETSQLLSGYFNINFQKTQWVQLQAVLQPSGSSSSSLCRLAQIILR